MRSKRKYYFKGEVTTHIEDTLPLVGDSNEVAILRIKVLRQVQVIGIADIGQVGTVDEKGTNDVAGFPVDELRTNPRIDEGIGSRRNLRIQGAIDVVLLPVVCHPDFEIGAGEHRTGPIGQLESQLAVKMRSGCPGDVLGRIGGVGQP